MSPSSASHDGTQDKEIRTALGNKTFQGTDASEQSKSKGGPPSSLAHIPGGVEVTRPPGLKAGDEGGQRRDVDLGSEEERRNKGLPYSAYELTAEKHRTPLVGGAVGDPDEDVNPAAVKRQDHND